MQLLNMSSSHFCATEPMCLICSDLMSSMPAALLTCSVEIPFCSSSSEIGLVKRDMFWSTPGSLCLCELVVLGAFPFFKQLICYFVCRNIIMLFELWCCQFRACVLWPTLSCCCVLGLLFQSCAATSAYVVKISLI